jgi:hypothetical protein
LDKAVAVGALLRDRHGVYGIADPGGCTADGSGAMTAEPEQSRVNEAESPLA